MWVLPGARKYSLLYISCRPRNYFFILVIWFFFSFYLKGRSVLREKERDRIFQLQVYSPYYRSSQGRPGQTGARNSIWICHMGWRDPSNWTLSNAFQAGVGGELGLEPGTSFGTAGIWSFVKCLPQNWSLSESGDHISVSRTLSG